MLLYSLNLTKFKNLRIILTHKYLIFITQNGLINLNTNFFNIFFSSLYLVNFFTSRYSYIHENI